VADTSEVSDGAQGRPPDVMLVRMGGSSYALPVASVREVVRLPAVTRVPGLPSFVAGLTNVRGRVLAVLDLRQMLRLDGPRGDRLVILDGGAAQVAQAGSGARGSRAMVGLIVDAALDMVQLPPGALEPLPPGLPSEAASILDGITVLAGMPIAVLTPSGLLSLRGRLAQPA
jgi:purine-binding chemotaxis protein CheW